MVISEVKIRFSNEKTRAVSPKKTKPNIPIKAQAVSSIFIFRFIFLYIKIIVIEINAKIAPAPKSPGEARIKNDDRYKRVVIKISLPHAIADMYTADE